MKFNQQLMLVKVKMKLIDFMEHRGLALLREMMGAPLMPINYDHEWERIKVQLENSGIEVDISEIDIASDSTFEYKGQKVTVYIRDQYQPSNGKKWVYKFHISNCSKYESMVNENRQKRYVVTSRKDGLFLVNILDRNLAPKESIEVKLNVCILCLNNLGITLKSEDFSISNFFLHRNNTIRSLPKHTDISSPVNNYTHDWPEVSYNYKVIKLWRCENPSCAHKKLDFMKESERKFLHVHHIDFDKSNNNQDNLQSLCIECHSNQPGHQLIKQSSDYLNFHKYV